MYRYHTLNNISKVINNVFNENYEAVDDMADAEAVLVRSAKMHDLELPDSLLTIARAGTGVNNIPLDKCAEKGIVVFNAPGANANLGSAGCQDPREPGRCLENLAEHPPLRKQLAPVRIHH